MIETITRDHSGSDPYEKGLVEAKGGFIIQKDKRKTSRVQGELALTR